MSLLKQLFLAICLFLLVAFSGSFIVGLENSRGQHVEQLRSHAQDAATALGLSLTPHVDDPAMIEVMVNAIFDSGYFARIEVRTLPDRSVLVERDLSDSRITAPDWFVRLVNLQAQGGDAIIMRGWEEAASVHVVSHPQFALNKLWQSALGSLFWLGLCGLISAVIGGWLLRYQLRPLDYMVRQARAITRREYLLAPQMPSPPELQRVVQAMNQMVGKLKSLFEEEAARSEALRRQAYQDELTGLANRRWFDMQLKSLLNPDEHKAGGFLLILHLNDLAGLNQRLGGKPVDQLIQSLAQVLEQHGKGPHHPGWMCARSRAGELALLAPGLASDDAEQLATMLAGHCETLREQGLSDCTPVAWLALAAMQPGETPAHVMQRADQALQAAQSRSDQPWALVEEHNPNAERGQSYWQNRLEKALEQNLIQLFLQPVVNCHNRDLLHEKVLARLDDQGDSEPLNAGRFLPWIERLGLGAELDRLMLDKVLQHLQFHQGTLALSLSPASAQHAPARERLIALLQQHPEARNRLVLEMDERHLPPTDALLAFARHLRYLGVGLGIQHFGGRFSLIGNLTHMGLAYLKIDGSYIHGIDQEPDRHLFLEAMQRAARSIDLPLIAEMVETPGELAVLKELGIQGATGRLLGKPHPEQH
ncbi:EAL domain, c-di-GMP-specific phosphodiesterase class I (or its enzymatically inactive variant) [Atopomonas hussainii]|uniref:EAL domain, c-di-GMP-specific phosphodiesterase class I (Or its enzymatically inactive variant) n=1 Tax=Atopomonas hussainii TaxID=1429083 RepID=A0A1H7RNS6_9GAMM|nr:EAL domain-containing protein [Atopomonas hussainii]SEL61950.1 EAL domain, c-di-GMP-specific phosphodiesterase class I (or its enzymatically inactive variant) [Atopomonas hussainii]